MNLNYNLFKDIKKLIEYYENQVREDGYTLKKIDTLRKQNDIPDIDEDLIQQEYNNSITKSNVKDTNSKANTSVLRNIKPSSAVD